MKLARFCVRYRTLFVILFLLAAGWALLHLDAAVINYDLTSYLGPETDTARGLRRMNEAFEETASFRLALNASDDGEAAGLAARISALPGVMSAAFDPARNVEDGGETWRLIEVLTASRDAEEAYAAAEALLSDVPHLSAGSVKDGHTMRDSIAREMPAVMLVSCAIVFLILLVMTRAWIQPFLFFLVIGVSILLNMGTNLIFPSISFITFAVTAILQLALAMDYSIMLINAYDRELTARADPAEAMIRALAATYMPVLSSSLTTVAGMLSLVTMSFTIGYDIGIVLAKGILLSMATVFFLMPGLLVGTAGLARRTGHRLRLRLDGAPLVRFLRRSRGAVPLCLILLVAAGAVVQLGNTYAYTVQSMDGDSATVSRLFGDANQVVLLYPGDGSDGDFDRERAMLAAVGGIQAGGHPVVHDVYAMTTTGAQALEMYDAAALAAMMDTSPLQVSLLMTAAGIRLPVRADLLLDQLMARRGLLNGLASEEQLGRLDELYALLGAARTAFRQNGQARAVITLDLNGTDPERGRVIRDLKAALEKTYGGDYALTGMMIATNDIADSFEGDVRRVSLLTIGAVFLIILISFRSALIPALLVLVIQGAVWLNMAVSGLLDGQIFFMCYLICMALQMGATIDYGILLTTHYRAARRTLPPWEAAERALTLSLPTLLTSGLALVIAGFSVGLMSSVFYISSIGIMLGRGALASLALIVLLLPCLLVFADRRIVRIPATPTPGEKP